MISHSSPPHSDVSSTDFLVSLPTVPQTGSPGKAWWPGTGWPGGRGSSNVLTLQLYLFAYLSLSHDSRVPDGRLFKFLYFSRDWHRVWHLESI